ncbi:MAG: sugar phosphate isomerase/epimerase family protein [Eubacteriales bacterium]
MSKFESWKLSASTSSFGTLDRALFKTYADAGIGAMEISTDYDGYFKTLDFPNHAKEFGDLAKEAGVWLRSFHLPFGSHLDVSSADAANREFTMKTNEILIEACARADISVVVIHPSSEPIADDARAERMKYSAENLGILARRCAELGMRLAVEDLPRTCLGHNSDEISALLSPNPELYITFDTNHLLIQDNIEFIRAVGAKIITTHVSDYDFIDERHLMPLTEGCKNDWKAIISALEAVGYDGVWNYELKRLYTPAEVAENKRLLGTL